MSEAIRAAWSAIRHAFSDWDVEKLGRDTTLHVVAAVLIALVASQWDRIRWYVTRDRCDFRRMFGRGATRSREIVVVLDTFRDTRWLSVDVQRQLNVVSIAEAPAWFYKTFPDGHFTAFALAEQPILPYASARAAAYVTDSVAGIRGVAVRPVADEEAGRWDATIVCIGSSYNNIRSDDIKLSAVNQWLADDGGPPRLLFKDGAEEGIDQRRHLGYVLKVPNPHSPEHACIVCGGIGANGTSGGARYFADNWRRLSRRFRHNGFLIVLAVTPGSDQATREIRAYGRESIGRRTWAWIVRTFRRGAPKK